MKTFRFLQFSDAHVDSRLTHSKLHWPPDKRDQRIREINALVQKVCRQAQEHKVEAILIPGDLWDDESVSAETVTMLIETFGAIAPISVFIAPGNHDFCAPVSYYSNETLRARGMRLWPENVFIFRSSQFASFAHPTRPEVEITGRAFLQNVSITERLLGQPINRPPADINILMFHGSLLQYAGRDAGLAGKITAPFSKEELLAQGFSYAALGHYHHYTELPDEAGRIRAAYAGSLAGRFISEIGPHYALLGEIDAHSLCGGFEKIRIDERMVFEIEVDLTDATTDTMVERVGQKLEEAGTTKDDIVYLRLGGRLSHGTQTASIKERFQDAYFHLSMIDHTRPAYDIEIVDPRTTEGRFISEIKRMMDATTDEQERARLDRALYYGLDALFQGEVKPAYED
jgi:DNA repair exonuclease SbcCD nuclease subunit